MVLSRLGRRPEDTQHASKPGKQVNKKDPEFFYPSYISTYIERDVRQIKNIENLNNFSNFLQLCAGRTGQVVNLNSLATDAGISPNTAKSWLSILEASFIIYFLQPYYKNFNKRIIKSPKLYFYDTGLVCSLLGISSPNQVKTFHSKGALFENLRYWQKLSGEKPQNLNVIYGGHKDLKTSSGNYISWKSIQKISI